MRLWAVMAKELAPAAKSLLRFLGRSPQLLLPQPHRFHRLSIPRGGWRFFSLPWLITVLLFGFLPWCEVSCQKTEIRLTQSGYQAVYGEVSLPPGVDNALVKQAEKTSLNLEATRKQLGFERSYLANVSPFLIFFWIACVCLTVIICSVPLVGLRLGFTLPLAGVMLVTLIVHAAIGLPLERRFGLVMGEFLRKDAESMLAVAAFTSGKTVWFWLILACVGLLGLSESLLNWLRAEYLRWQLPTIIGGSGLLFSLSGVVIQFCVREAIVSNVESRIAQVQKAEAEKRQRIDAEYRRQQEALWAAAEQHKAESERLRQQAAVKAEEARLAELQHRRERERLEREEKAAEAKRREEREREWRQQQEEARAKAEEEAKARREAESRQARIDSDEVQAKKLLKLALQLKARGGFKKQVQEKLKEIIDKYPDTPSAAKAKSFLDNL